MLTKEQNDRFTRVGPGTPMGELMRRYWMPFATVSQLDQHPTRAVDILGEHLIAYKDRSGGYGLMQEFCPHRNVNMLWGIPEAEGLRCPYHGWLFDNTGNCLEQPAESPDSTFKDRIKVQTYPVEELGGMLWAWMGPLDKKPMVPRWEAMVKDGIRDIGWAILPCNWLQIMENSLDPVHVEWLHQYFANYVMERLDRPFVDPAFWRQRTDVRKHVKIGFDIFEHGIVKRRVLDGDDETHPNWALGHPICFPNMLRQDQIRVPIDDTHTLFWWYNVRRRATSRCTKCRSRASAAMVYPSGTSWTTTPARTTLPGPRRVASRHAGPSTLASRTGASFCSVAYCAIR
jgi:5,5'-dehydrodivanillate O-demethylase